MRPHDDAPRPRNGGRRRQRRLALNVLGFLSLFFVCVALGVFAADRFLVTRPMNRPSEDTRSAEVQQPSRSAPSPQPIGRPDGRGLVNVTEVPPRAEGVRRSPAIEEFIRERSQQRPTRRTREREAPRASVPEPPSEPAAEEVVVPEEPAPPTAPEEERTGPIYNVQAGAFEVEDNARKLADDLAVSGYAASIATKKSGGRTLYKVVVGSFDREEEARKMQSELRGKGFEPDVMEDQ